MKKGNPTEIADKSFPIAINNWIMFDTHIADVEYKFSYKQFLKKDVTTVNKYIENSKAL